MISGDVHVPAGTELEIGPGVTVFFAGAYRFVINGRLDARGADEDSVFFTTDTLLYPQRWYGLKFEYPTDTCRFSHAVIEHCRKTGDQNFDQGISAERTTLSFDSCAIRFGQSGFYAVVNIVDSSSAMFTNCAFSHNRDPQNGGGACYVSQQSFATFERCLFHHNSALDAGAIEFEIGARGILSHCTFENNNADVWGGAVYADCPGITIRGCVFLHNRAFQGGAVRVEGGDYTIEKCLFLENSTYRPSNGSSGWGGAMELRSWSGHTCHVAECTFVGNKSPTGSAIFTMIGPTDATILISSCIFAENDSGDVLDLYSPLIDVRHNAFYVNDAGNFAGGDTALGLVSQNNLNGDSCDAYFNIFLNPQFVDTANGDYHLSATSPCIDAGDPELSLDPDSTIADIGAFYFDQTQAVDDSFIVPRSSLIVSSYPNPFNSSTQIRFDLPVASHVTLTVFDLLGREVAILNDEPMAAGTHARTFDAANLPSGVYLYRLRTAAAAQTHKMILLK